MEFLKTQLSDLPAVARQLIEFAGEERVWGFSGEIGAGKTTLIKQICEALGVEEDVVSPTFSLVNTYKARDRVIHHFDWYRIRQEGEAIEIGWEEYLAGEDLLLLEWPENIEGLLPEEYLELVIEEKTPGYRDIRATHRSWERS